MSLIAAGTGHRPDKVRFANRAAYDGLAYEKLVEFASVVIARVAPTEIISGMALGWDMALADGAIRCNVPFRAYVPFAGQEGRWPQSSQQKYHALLEKASEVRIICEGGYGAWKMQRRNEAMVQDCDVLLSLWNGSDGGTANCIRFAESVDRRIIQLWECWEMFAR